MYTTSRVEHNYVETFWLHHLLDLSHSIKEIKYENSRALQGYYCMDKINQRNLSNLLTD